jgi:hypothetical protein
VKVWSGEELEELRDRNYHRTPALRVATIEDAASFVDENGICFAFKAERSELPCLWHAACGRRDPEMPHHTHHDPAIGLVWRAKDVLPEQKRIYYGKAIRKRPTMIALDLFPDFFAAAGHPVAEELIDPFAERLTPDARRVLEVLLDSPPLPTRILREQSGFGSSRGRAAFGRAMTELQQSLLVTKIAETYEPFTFIWGRLDRWLVEQVEQAMRTTTDTGRRRVVARYFERVVASTALKARRLFGWDPAAAIEELADERMLIPARVHGAEGWWTHRRYL